MNQVKIVLSLLRRDAIIMRASLLDNLIDSMIIVFFTYLIFGRMLPIMGLQEELVTPIFFGVLIIVLFNIAFDRTLRDVFDLDAWRVIDHHRTLPITSAWLLAKYLLSYCMELLYASLPILIMGRLVYGSLLHIEHLNIPLFCITYLLSVQVVSTLFLMIAMRWPWRWVTSNTWPRIGLPLILLGSLYYPWSAVHAVAPLMGIIMLFLPTLYIVEGLRYAVSGSSIYLPWYITLSALVVMEVLLLAVLWQSFMRRLDPVRDNYV